MFVDVLLAAYQALMNAGVLELSTLRGVFSSSLAKVRSRRVSWMLKCRMLRGAFLSSSAKVAISVHVVVALELYMHVELSMPRSYGQFCQVLNHATTSHSSSFATHVLTSLAYDQLQF